MWTRFFAAFLASLGVSAQVWAQEALGPEPGWRPEVTFYASLGQAYAAQPEPQVWNGQDPAEWLGNLIRHAGPVLLIVEGDLPLLSNAQQLDWAQDPLALGQAFSGVAVLDLACAPLATNSRDRADWRRQADCQSMVPWLDFLELDAFLFLTALFDAQGRETRRWDLPVTLNQVWEARAW